MDDDDHIVLEENIIIEEEEESMHAEPEPEKIVKLRDSADDDVLQVGVEDEGLDDEREVIEEGSVEDGEIEEEQKKSHKTLRVHLPDLLQGIDNDDEDPFITSKNIEKLEKRAKRFNMENDLSAEDCNRVLRSLDIPVEERELRAQGRYKLDCIEMFGLFGVGEADLKEYFGHHLFEEVSFPEDDIGIVRFRTDINAFRAMMKFSKPVGEPRKEERIIKHVLTADGSPERKVITKDVKDEFDKMVHPDDLPEERPEGKWRFGIKGHKKRDFDTILMRFPLKSALKKGHYLQNDRSARGSWKVQPPADIELIEEEEKFRRKNFDKKNPWADLSESWSNATRNAKDREYEIDLADLDHPPRRLATGLRDWDNPEDPYHAVQIRPRESRKRKLSDDMDEGPETFFEEEIPDSGEDGGEAADSDTEEEWKKKLKRPRLGMVADMEEQKQKGGIKSRLLGGQGAAKRLKTSGGPRIKRKISNNYVVSEKIIVESSEEDELNDPDLLEEAKNEDLRHHLTMRVENINKQTNRPILKATKRLTNRFAGPDSDEDDRGGAFENMKIQIRADDSSGQDEGMDVDDEHTDARTKLKKRREAKENLDHKRTSGDLRDRMSRDRKSADSDRKRDRRHDMDVDTSSSRRDKVRSPVDDLRKRMTGKSIKVKNEFEEERRKEENKRGKDKSQNSLDDERKEIDERMRELKDVKAQEKELLDKLNNKLKKMEQEKEELRRSKDRAPVRSADKGRRSPAIVADKGRRSPAIVADKSRRSPAVSATKDRRRRKSPEPVRQSRRKASPAKKRRKNRSPSSSSSSSSDYSSSEDSDSGSDSDDSDSDDSDSSSSSSSESDDSSSSSSSSDSDSSSGGDSKKKKYKSSSSRSKKDQKTSGSSSATKRKHATSSSSKKSSKPDIKEEKKSTKDSEKEKKPSSSSGKPTLEDKKKDADLKAKLENFVNKSKSKKDKK